MPTMSEHSLHIHPPFRITKSQYLLQGKTMNDEEINNKVRTSDMTI